MKTKHIFKVLAFAMLLTTACTNNEIPNEIPNEKGYALPVTINVTRQGDDDAATKATYTDNGDGTGALSFSTGDQLFVSGMHLAIPNGAGSFAGTLTWVSGGKFSGTIITENEWTGTADELFTAANSSGSVIAVLLPAGYGTYRYWSITDSGTCSAYINPTPNSAIASSKATAVEQFSCEMADTYSSGFALSPQNAILNFTISGLAPSTEVTATLKFGSDLLFSDLVSGSVTTDGSGNASFVMAIGGGFYNINELTLTIGGNDITITSSDVSLVAGKIYNITRSAVPATDLSTINANYTASYGETLTGTLASNVKISIADGATVILNNVIINGTNDVDYGWAGITCLGDATIILNGTNTVKGFYEDYPGIQAAAGKTLTINGTGSLTASSNGWGAGIGGGYRLSSGNVLIKSGTIVATGGHCAAGIGSGGSDENAPEVNCGTITITGGDVTATGGKWAAGIGSGHAEENTYCICGDITITNTVTRVTATKGADAPNSIGAGDGGTCGTITIEDPSKVTQN